MINKAILVGRTGQDVEITKFDNGNQVGKFSLATSERYTDQKGQKQEITQWHQCKIYGKGADVLQTYAKKGTLLYLEGMIEYRSYENQEGQTFYVTEIKVQEFRFLESKKDVYKDKSLKEFIESHLKEMADQEIPELNNRLNTD